MKNVRVLIVLLVISTTGHNCRNAIPAASVNEHDISNVIDEMTDVMVHDVTNPPLAARFFAYACLAGYEILSENDMHARNMYGVLKGYPVIGKPGQMAGYDYRLSAVIAMYKTAEKLQPSGDLMVHNEDNFLDSCRKRGFGDEVIDSSVHYAGIISQKILEYAKTDRYNRISAYTRYTPAGKPGTWEPTPPAYFTPVEPYFNTVRPLTLDSAAQFVPAPPIPFSTDKNSPFYKFLLLSYAKSGDGLTEEEKTIAGFWDCNPFAVQNGGHMLIGLKKISPGAHWLGIANIACKLAKKGFSATMEINTIVAIGLMDGFICCWDDKYRTNRIRPETAIRRYIDPNWKPLLQTPPFPEYISGHSVVSTVSAVILTHYLGDNFHFVDSVEGKYGLVPRSFTSFGQAAKEAAMSRFWGGIHFMDAIDNGIEQGQKVGEWIIAKLP